MEIEYDNKANYMSGGGKHTWNKEEFDFMLVRQDFNGFERVYFNKEEIEEVYDKIGDGEIMIHSNYSILYGKSRGLLDIIPEMGYGYPCYETVWGE